MCFPIALRFEAGGFKFEGTPLENQVLPEEWLKDWTRNLTTILSYLKVSHAPISTFRSLPLTARYRWHCSRPSQVDSKEDLPQSITLSCHHAGKVTLNNMPRGLCTPCLRVCCRSTTQRTPSEVDLPRMSEIGPF